MHYILADKETYFENHHHQKSFNQENELNMFPVLLFYLDLLLILLFFANSFMLLSKSELFINP